MLRYVVATILNHDADIDKELLDYGVQEDDSVDYDLSNDVSEVMGPGPTEESAANGKESTLEFLLSFSKWVERFNLFHIWRTTIY